MKKNTKSVIGTSSSEVVINNQIINQIISVPASNLILELYKGAGISVNSLSNKKSLGMDECQATRDNLYSLMVMVRHSCPRQNTGELDRINTAICGDDLEGNPILRERASNLVLDIYKTLGKTVHILSNKDYLDAAGCQTIRTNLYAVMVQIRHSCPPQSVDELEQINAAICGCGKTIRGTIQLVGRIHREAVASKADTRWQARYNELVNFKNQNGHANINISSGGKLAIWATEQRRKYKSQLLSADRIDTLNQIGFKFEAQ